MRLRSALLILVFSLLLGSSGPVFADDAVLTRSDVVTSIQSKYNPLFDVQYARFMAVKAKIINNPSKLQTFNEIIADFLQVRNFIDSSLKSSTVDLDVVMGYAEEELGEFENSLFLLEKAVTKKITITCIKGKQVKKVSGQAPKCPKGYKKK